MTEKTKSNCCDIQLHIEKSGDVHIHNCCCEQQPKKKCDDTKPPTPCEDPVGTCIPVAAGAKHKLGRDYKMNQFAGSMRVPSAIAASTVHMARRFVAGKSPGSPLETKAFPLFEKISREMLSCTIKGFDSIPVRQHTRIFASLPLGPDDPMDEGTLVTALSAEIKKRVSDAVFQNVNAAEEERPGSIRVFKPGGEDFFTQVRICRVNGLRTANFIPALNPGDYLPGEIQQDCAPVIVNGQPQVVCQVRTTDCPGTILPGNVCGRVVEIGAGDGVILEGVNYFSVDAIVRFTDRETGAVLREVDAHVFGDLDTPVTEVINGETRLINDCRVHDKATFQVPADLPPRVYQIQVVVPNITGIPEFGPTIASNFEFIRVMPPVTARFQIVTEKIRARQETSPSWLGSDEVGLRTLSMPLFLDGNFGDPQEQKFKDIQDDDFDSGTQRDITRNVFTHNQPILAMVMTVLGHEIDSQRAYDEEITSRMDFFVDLIKEQAGFIKAGIAALGGLSALTKLGWTGVWIAAIAAVVTLGIDIIVALWAPADPIIRDNFGLTAVDLDILTNANFPAPAPFTFKTEGPGDISVNVSKSIPAEKIPLQYRETREYVSGSEDSRYELSYRYNRTA